MTSQSGNRLLGCLVSAGLLILTIPLLFGTIFCFVVACEWLRAKTTFGAVPSNAALAAVTISIGGIALLVLASSLFPIRSYLRRRSRSANAGESPSGPWREFRSMLMVFCFFATAIATLLAVTMRQEKVKSQRVVETGIVRTFGTTYVAGEEEKREALMDAVQCERLQYRAVTAAGLSISGFFVVLIIHIVSRRRRTEVR